MDPNTPRDESERWLTMALKLLTARDFVRAKTFAIRAKESDPNNDIPDQILAVVETVMAGDKRVNSSQHPDWYTVLQLPRLVRDPDLITNHYRRLVTLLNPERNRLPFSDYALQLVMDAWSILSDPGKKWLFDNELAVYLQRVVEDQSGAAPVVASSAAVADAGEVSTFQFFHQPPQQTPPPTVNPWQQQQQQQIEFMQPMQMQMQMPQQVGPQWQMRDPTPVKGGERNKGVINGIAGGIGVTPPIRQVVEVEPRGNSVPIVTPMPARVIDGNVVINNAVNNCEATSNVGVVHEDNVVGSANVDDNNCNGNGNGEIDGGVEEVEVEEELEVGETFWTSCPYCLYIFEYQKEYQECTLRCQNCRKGFQAVQIPNPPPISARRGDKNNKTSFCCWGFFPLGFSAVAWKKHNGMRKSNVGANWVPFSPIFASPVENGGGNFEWFANGSGGASVGPKSTGRPPVYQRRVYDVIDDDDDFDSDPSDYDSSDLDWRRKPGLEKKRKKNKRGKFGASRTPRKVNPQNGYVENQEIPNPVTESVVSAGGEDLENRSNTQNDSLNAGAKEEAKKKVAAPVTRSQGRRRVKNMGRLDLNVEFNNEGDEHAPTVSAVNRGEDGVENIEFFEGLDEFLSTLPILNVDGDEKAKPS